MTLKKFILCQLRELKRETLHALTGISQRDLLKVTRYSPHPIGWLVQHCMSVIDYTIVRHVTGRQLFTYPPGLSKCPIDAPTPEDAMPDLATLRTRWKELLDHTAQSLAGLDDEKLSQQSVTGIEPLVQSCLRAINHTNTHLRGIWCILTHDSSGLKWPSQPTWMEDPAVHQLIRELEVPLRSAGPLKQDVAEIAARYAPRILTHDNRAALDCCEDLMDSGQVTHQTIAILLLEAMHGRLTENDFCTMERWLEQYVRSADVCDDFCNRVLRPMIEQSPTLSIRMRDWIDSPNPVLNKAAKRLIDQQMGGHNKSLEPSP